jgi:predicted SpoU family rRNA methylase
MGFDLNENITTVLNWKEVSLIAVAIGEYQRLYSEDSDEDVMKTMSNLVNRLGTELSNCKQI